MTINAIPSQLRLLRHAVFGRVPRIRARPRDRRVPCRRCRPKCALVDADPRPSATAVVTACAVAKGAFPGTSAWRPPI